MDAYDFCGVDNQKSNGVDLHALGARIRSDFASVGAIRSVQTGVRIISGLTLAPNNISGAGISAERTTRLSLLFSCIILHPGNTLISKSPERLR